MESVSVPVNQAPPSWKYGALVDHLATCVAADLAHLEIPAHILKKESH
jgi:hypothetical protein